MIKHGYPWASMIRLKSINPQIFQELTSVSDSIDWGENYANHRTSTHAIALYETTRKVAHSYNRDCVEYPEFSNVAKKLYNDVIDCFPHEEMMLYHSQLIILLPGAVVEWHNDRALMTYIGTRVMIPINEVDVSYYFATWLPNTPTDDDNFKGSKYVDFTKVQEIKNPPIGNYYIYNNRVPHRTVNWSDKPRYIVLMDITSTREFIQHGSVNGMPPHYYPLTDEEKNATLLPAIV